jgi:hypothetical protein
VDGGCAYKVVQLVTPVCLQIAFFENGGGSILEVSWSPTPGANLVPLSVSLI